MPDTQSLSNFELFHRLWSQAVDSSRYDKQEWIAMEQRLLRINFLSKEKPAL